MGGRPDLAVSVLCPQVSHVSGVGLHATGRENGVKRDPRGSCCQLACLVRSFCLFAGWLVLFCSVFRCHTELLSECGYLFTRGLAAGLVSVQLAFVQPSLSAGDGATCC